MNSSIKRATACNYLYRYGINKLHLEELQKEIGKSDYILYKKNLRIGGQLSSNNAQ